jgi:ABC-type phosphate transport system auxiliary subunit
MPKPNLSPHQERVILERLELEEKLAKLRTFLESHTFDNLYSAERGRLHRQYAAMMTYSNVLKERIDAF